MDDFGQITRWAGYTMKVGSKGENMATKTDKRLSSRTKDIVFCGLIVALMVVSAWVTIPIGLVPVTLQLFVMVFALLLLSPRQFFASLSVYLVLGAIGLPVFSGMRGGIGVIAGPTGGFLWGFLLGALAAYAVFFLLGKRGANPEKEMGKGRLLVAEIAATAAFFVVMYVCGWAQLMFVAGLDPMAAFLAGVAPFVVIDLVKASVAFVAVKAVKHALPVNALA